MVAFVDIHFFFCISARVSASTSVGSATNRQHTFTVLNTQLCSELYIKQMAYFSPLWPISPQRMARFSCVWSISPHFHTTLFRVPDTSTNDDGAEKCEIYVKQCYIVWIYTVEYGRIL